SDKVLESQRSPPAVRYQRTRPPPTSPVERRRKQPAQRRDSPPIALPRAPARPVSPTRQPRPKPGVMTQQLNEAAADLRTMRETGPAVIADANRAMDRQLAPATHQAPGRTQAVAGKPIDEILDLGDLLHLKKAAASWCYYCTVMGRESVTHKWENCPDGGRSETYEMTDITHNDEKYTAVRSFVRHEKGVIPYNSTICFTCFWPFKTAHDHPLGSGKMCPTTDFLLPLMWLLLANDDLRFKLIRLG
ncbi:hypothetical protein FRC07_003128, partial [Ceratobasidium sp. 392]